MDGLILLAGAVFALLGIPAGLRAHAHGVHGRIGQMLFEIARCALASGAAIALALMAMGRPA